MNPLRLNIYCKYITKFDCIERNFDHIKFCKLKNYNSKLSSDISGICFKTLGLTLEILTQQRFLVNNKNSQQIIYIKTSINKNRRLLLLDLFLNSVYLNKTNTLSFSYKEIVNKLYFFITNQVTNNLKLEKLPQIWINTVQNNNIYNLLY